MLGFDFMAWFRVDWSLKRKKNWILMVLHLSLESRLQYFNCLVLRLTKKKIQKKKKKAAMHHI